MNLPNLISCARIIMVPLFVYFYMRGSTELSMAVLLLCGFSDVLDGMIARRFNMVTDLGKILDPVADKLIQAAMMLCLAYRFPALWLVLGLHIFRELTLAAVGMYVMKSTGAVSSARWYGKLCTGFIYAVMLLLLLVPDMKMQLANTLVLGCAALICLCFVLYFASYLRQLKHWRTAFPD